MNQFKNSLLQSSNEEKLFFVYYHVPQLDWPYTLIFDLSVFDSEEKANSLIDELRALKKHIETRTWAVEKIRGFCGEKKEKCRASHAPLRAFATGYGKKLIQLYCLPSAMYAEAFSCYRRILLFLRSEAIYVSLHSKGVCILPSTAIDTF